MNSSFLVHQVSCSVILAAALTEFFPTARIQSFQATEKCFFCDVVFPFSFEREALPLLEERMRMWVKKNIPFQVMEMMPANAAQYLEHHGCPTVAAGIRLAHDLVQIVRLDRFIGRASGKTLSMTGDIKFFKLIQAYPHGECIRLLGTSATTKESLKSHVEACKNISDHLLLAQELGLLTSECLWLPRGEMLKDVLIAKVLKISELDRISSPALDEAALSLYHAQYCKRTGRGVREYLKKKFAGVGSDLLDPQVGTCDRLSLPLTEEGIISFLQIIEQFFKIFPFGPRTVVVGKSAKLLKDALKKQKLEVHTEKGEKPGVEFRLCDAIGREWTGPRLWIEEKAGLVALSLFHSLERFTALLLEKTEGKLPFGLQPEQVRLISLGSTYAGEIQEKVQNAGFRIGLDRDEKSLSQRLSRALRERVPFSIVIGERECKTGQLTVREEGGAQSLIMNVETLIDRLRQLESQ